MRKLPKYTMSGDLVEDQLFAAKVIAAIFNTYNPDSARICGGYLRDVLTGREPKDIDVIVQHTDSSDVREIRILADRLGCKVTDTHSSYGEYSDDCGACGDFVGVVKLHHEKTNMAIDVILTKPTPAERIEIFPANSSRVWLEGDKLCYTDDFAQFVEDHKLVFTDNAPQGYIDRMNKYYPQD